MIREVQRLCTLEICHLVEPILTFLRTRPKLL
jgi:hypothetical protein